MKPEDRIKLQNTTILELKKENQRLYRAVAELENNILVLTEALKAKPVKTKSETKEPLTEKLIQND